ncbi:MAG: HAD family phosphatase [Promethearchaeia archaeon]
MNDIGFIFDLDGTLINTTEIGDEIREKIMEKYDITISKEKRKELEDLAEGMFQKSYSTTLAIKIIWRLLKEVGLGFFKRLSALIFAGRQYLKESKNIITYDGVFEIFEFLDRKGIEYIIITSSSENRINRSLKNLPEFKEKVKDRIITEDAVDNLKPHPESFELAQKMIDLPDDHIVVIGDTKYDILFGQNIGAVTVAVLTGIYSQELLDKFNPDFIFDSVKDIKKNFNLILQELHN